MVALHSERWQPMPRAPDSRNRQEQGTCDVQARRAKSQRIALMHQQVDYLGTEAGQRGQAAQNTGN
jgi:hypothetical protein